MVVSLGCVRLTSIPIEEPPDVDPGRTHCQVARDEAANHANLGHQQAQWCANENVETDVERLDGQSHAPADVDRLADQIALLTAKLEAVQADVIDFRNLPIAQAPQAGGGGLPWWEWVRQYVSAEISELSAEISGLSGETAEAIGRIADRSRIEFDELGGTTSLLQRELGVLKNEIGVEKELREFRSSIMKAQRAIPQVPTIIAGMRDEAQFAKVETDRQLAELRRQAKADRRAVAQARVEQACTAAAMKRGLGQEMEVQWEASSRSARMTIKPALHPDAMKTLREFSGRVINGSLTN